MDNFKVLHDYQRLQFGVMFDEQIDLGFAVINFCKDDRTLFWNTALTNNLLSTEQLQEIKSKFNTLDRQPAIYFEVKPELNPLGGFLSQNNFKESFEESWMFHSGKGIDTSQFDEIKKVITLTDLEIFLKTFDECYKADDPKNPYGPITPGYMKSAREVWKKHQATSHLEYFIGFEGDKPVAVATLNNFEDYGYISNIGSLQEVRGKGFGKLITLYCVQKSKDRGHNFHFLITEEESYPNEFYKRIGFETRIRGICYANI